MEFSWKDNPFLRILLPLIFGIIVYEVYPSNYWVIGVVISLISAIFIGLFNLLNSFYKHRYKWLKGIFIHLLIFSFGYSSCVLHSITSSPIWYKKWDKNVEYALVKVAEDIQEKPKTMKVIVEVSRLITTNKSIDVQGKAILYLQKSNRSKQLRMGDILLIKNAFNNILSLGNPGSFNYYEYCHRQQIYQSAFLRDFQWKQTSQHVEGLMSFLNSMGRRTRAQLKKQITNSESLGLAEALLMGYRNDIDNEIWQAYSNAGIVHIIAISGMHMAMIFTSVRWLLMLIPFMKKKPRLTIFVAIISMWFFAGMTGLPPSVTRAAIMFTCMGLGEMFDKNINGMNNLALSACVLLCINPFWLMDVGFQLSYLAVLSLILFYSNIYQWFFVPNFILDQIWKLMSATIAAQILTFPLCIYYFHQFPLLFLFTNLIAVPATTIILYLEILYLFISWIEPLAKLLGSFISWSIYWMNHAVAIVSNWSFTRWEGININSIQVVVLYIIIVSLALWLIRKRARALQISLILVLTFSLINFDRNFRIANQRKILVYNMAGRTRLEFIQQHFYYSPDEDSISKNQNLIRYTVKPAHLSLGLSKSNANIVQTIRNESIQLYSFQHKTILRLLNTKMKFTQKVHIDYLIITGKCKIDVDWISQNCVPKLIILDSSIPTWKTDRYKLIFDSLKIPAYCVHDEGAFLASF